MLEVHPLAARAQGYAYPSQRSKLGHRFHAKAYYEPDRLLQLLDESGADWIVVESGYVDADFRDEFVNFYATIHLSVPDRCERIHAFSLNGSLGSEHELLPVGANYLGFIVVRPWPATAVGRTCLPPPRHLEPYVSCYAATSVSLLGQEYVAFGFPFTAQDYHYTTCGPTSLWMVALYHHLVNRSNRVFVSDIVGRGKLDKARRPGQGEDPAALATMLDAAGLPSSVYSYNAMGREAQATACRYLNSRVPVLLVAKKHRHVCVLVGYGRDRKGRFFFVAADEGDRPYVRVAKRSRLVDGAAQMIISFPGKLYSSGAAAEALAQQHLRALVVDDPSLAAVVPWSIDSRPRRSRLRRPRLRAYVTRGSTYQRDLEFRGMAEPTARQLRALSLSRWVWVVEFHDRRAYDDGRASVVAEMVVDGTSSERNGRVLAGYVMGRPFAGQDEDLVDIAVYDGFSDGETGWLSTGSALDDRSVAPVAP